MATVLGFEAFVSFSFFSVIGAISIIIYIYIVFWIPGVICNGHYCKERGFTSEVMGLADKLVSCTRRLWQLTKVQCSLVICRCISRIFSVTDRVRVKAGDLRLDDIPQQNNPSLIAVPFLKDLNYNTQYCLLL